ncbi:aminotransferase class I/II-fold pyridoxal phosphate-dependent enzyme [Acaryochloris marina NIES-2412]|uniref:aminotransferase class I/II-fold pyridoxal phosphate-dependent enzyme n=1 Tax=Acaryochloris marina TaxID=155978 RepID=UPI0040584CE6
MSNSSNSLDHLSAEEKRELLAELLQKKADAEPEIPPEHYRFDLYPEYLQLKEQQAQLQANDIRNPYFSVHEGIARDTTCIDGKELINFSSYNYLGLAGHPTVSETAKQAIDRYGTSVSASRPVSGEKALHLELEQGIADFIGVDDAVLYVAGHGTNVTTIGHLFGRNDLILYDAYSHNSIFLGCMLSGARAMSFAHNDAADLERLLKQHRQRYQRVLVVIEGVYSADGDIPDLPKFIELKERHKAFLMVDEAHSIGVLGEHGQGISEHFGLDPTTVDIWMGTLSKSFASCGGYIAGSQPLIEYLKCTAPGFIYSIGITPANTAASLAALQVLKKEPERVARLHARAQFFLDLAKEKGLNTGTSHGSAVIPVMVGDTLKALHLSQQLFHQGINVQPMTFPVVPQNEARLRFFLSSTHTEDQIRQTVDTLATALAHIETEIPA